MAVLAVELPIPEIYESAGLQRVVVRSTLRARVLQHWLAAADNRGSSQLLQFLQGDGKCRCTGNMHMLEDASCQVTEAGRSHIDKM